MREFFIKDNGPCCVEKAFKMIGARWTPRMLELCYPVSYTHLDVYKRQRSFSESRVCIHFRPRKQTWAVL